MRQSAYFHQCFLLVLVLIFACLNWLLGFHLNQQMVFFLVITLSIGIFHGMLDIVLLQQDFVAKKLVTTSLLYTGFAIACVLALLALPLLMIPILLLISVWHFGEKQGEKQSSYSQEKNFLIQRIVIGGAAVSMPYLVAQPALLQLLNMLSLSVNALKIALFVWQFISLFWLITLLLVVIAGLFNIYQSLNKVQWFEIAIVMLAFVLLPPLLAFSLYFGAYHALRHIRDVLQTSKTLKNQSFKNQFKYILVIALASACLLAAVAAFLATKNFTFSTITLGTNISTNQLFHATLILLVAVTLPHAFLITHWRKNSY